VLPNYLDGERLRSASLPLLKLHEDAKQPASKDVETEEPYDGYRGESTGLGYCTKWDCDFKGNFAFILWEWPDEVATLEEPLRLVRSGRGFSRGTHAVATLEEPLPPLWSQKPTGRGVTIVYEGVPSSGRSSREIAVCPVGGGATGE